VSAVLWQRIEGALVFAACLALIAAFGLFAPVGTWWVWLIVFFLPDLGFLGYLAGPRVGAFVYNALHFYAGGLLLAAGGLLGLGTAALTAFGLLWVAHVGFDRMLGYGLKAPTGFNDTHLGRIGRT
jgi:Domain of unknown function (DUF4260)